MPALQERSVKLLSTTTVTFGSTGNTTLYTVPPGKTLVIDHVVVVASADCTTATVQIGRTGTTNDFLGTQTLSALNAAGAVGLLQPVPNATTPKNVNYAAGTVVVVNVIATGGGTAHRFDLFGYLY